MKALQTKKHMNFTKILFINTMKEEGAGCLISPPLQKKGMRKWLSKILEMALPVLIMLGLGYFYQSKNVFDEKGSAWLKSVHQQYYAAGMVLFNAFLCRVQCENCSVVCFGFMWAICLQSVQDFC